MAFQIGEQHVLNSQHTNTQDLLLHSSASPTLLINILCFRCK